MHITIKKSEKYEIFKLKTVRKEAESVTAFWKGFRYLTTISTSSNDKKQHSYYMWSLALFFAYHLCSKRPSIAFFV